MNESNKMDFTAKSIWGNKKDHRLMSKRYIHQELFCISTNKVSYIHTSEYVIKVTNSKTMRDFNTYL